MEKVIISCEFKEFGQTEIFFEEIVMNKGLNYEKEYKKMIENFNNTLRPHENKRIFVSVKIGDKVKRKFCEFEKTSLTSLQDSKGIYDRCKCIHCGKIRRRYSINSIELRAIKCRNKDV